jgi:hypothetical protein
MLLSGLRAGVADLSTGKPQIQGANLRIEFDHNLRRRVVVRFDNKETTMGLSLLLRAWRQRTRHGPNFP